MWKFGSKKVIICIGVICLAVIVCLFLFFYTLMPSEKQAMRYIDEILDAPIREIDEAEIETPAFLLAIEERNGYEMLSLEKTEGGAVARMRVYAPDVYSVVKMLDANGDFSSEADLAEALKLAMQDAPLVEKEVSIFYSLTSKGYVPNLTAEFLDAYYGGVYRLRDEIMAGASATEG